jgi:putative transposase
MDVWAYPNGVKLDFIRPGRPVETGDIESFNGRLRDECLNVHVFFDLTDAREKLESWRRDDNTFRPHGSLGGPCQKLSLHPGNSHWELSSERERLKHLSSGPD